MVSKIKYENWEEKKVRMTFPFLIVLFDVALKHTFFPTPV